MSTTDNINNMLDSGFQNFNYLPQGLSLEDSDQALFDFFDNLDFSIVDSTNIKKKVKVLYLTPELWAERRSNWKIRLAENGEEVLMPFMTLVRTNVKRGTSPMKFTIPNKKKFTFVKVPTFDGTLKGYSLYKVPQPVYVDLDYDLMFISHYQQDINFFYEKVMRDLFSDGILYLNIKGYPISCVISEPTEDNENDNVNSERTYRVTVKITVRSKLVNAEDFEKVPTINKIAIKIVEGK